MIRTSKIQNKNEIHKKTVVRLVNKSVGIATLILALFLTGCSSESKKNLQESEKTAEVTSEVSKEVEENLDINAEESYTKDIFAMDTYMTLTAYGTRAKDAVEAAITEINRLETTLSTNIETSEIAQLNQNQQGSVSIDTMELLQRGKEAYESTGGAFNIAVYPLMKEWGFTSGIYQVPEEGKIKELLAVANPSDINLDEDNLQVVFEQSGMGIDLGGIAKGYTSNRIMDIFDDYGIQSGVISLGGNVQLKGAKVDGSNWRVGIEDPKDTSQYIGVLEVADKAVITSGGYERYFEEDGKIYHHILDTTTGYPADSGIISVSIVTRDGTLGDILSTTLFIMGEEKAIQYWKQNWEKFDFILETSDEKLLVSEGIKDQFETTFDMTVIEKDE
jgi:thiamine biosynthesis lipoprotein